MKNETAVPERKFKGVWIPAVLWLNTKLSWMEKCVIAEIDALADDDANAEDKSGCKASNKYLARMFDVSEGRIANILSGLSTSGWIKRITPEDKPRQLVACFMRLTKSVNGVNEKREPPLTDSVNPPLNGFREPPLTDSVNIGTSEGSSQIGTSKENTAVVVEKTEKPETTAEEIYEQYPLKVARPLALAAIKKAAQRGTPMATLLERTIAFAEARGGNKEFCPMPATWFNQDRFNDDPETWLPKRNGLPVIPKNVKPVKGGW